MLLRDEALGQGGMDLVDISSVPYPDSSMVPYRCAARFDRRLVRGETTDGVLRQFCATGRGERAPAPQQAHLLHR